MSPKDAFSRKTRKRYKALRRIVRARKPMRSYVLIPGCQRATSTSPERVYLEARKQVTNSHFKSKKFYFYSTPKRSEVDQIIQLMLSVWELE